MKITQTYSASLFPVAADLNPTNSANATRERIIRSAAMVLFGDEVNGLLFGEILSLLTVNETLCVKGDQVTFEISKA